MQSLGDLQKLCSYASKQPVTFVPKPAYKCLLAAENFWEIIQFFSFDECAKKVTVSSTFARFIQPKLELKMQLLTEQIHETKRKLDETNKEIEHRREQIAELNGHIAPKPKMENIKKKSTKRGSELLLKKKLTKKSWLGKPRLVNMGERLQTMNEQIAASHDRINALMVRVKALK